MYILVTYIDFLYFEFNLQFNFYFLTSINTPYFHFEFISVLRQTMNMMVNPKSRVVRQTSFFRSKEKSLKEIRSVQFELFRAYHIWPEISDIVEPSFQSNCHCWLLYNEHFSWKSIKSITMRVCMRASNVGLLLTDIGLRTPSDVQLTVINDGGYSKA